MWIRTGIQARRTRNEGRVRALEALRVERSARRERVGTVRLQAQEAERSGRLVVEARDVSFSRDGRPIVRDFSTTIMRGDRVGVIGPNGSGKTTLLRLLLGELAPDEGTVRRGTGLEVAYFDQLREQLDPERSVFDSVADGAEFVTVGGQRRHVHGYLRDFLFSPDRARTPVRALSGGERNRLLLARLFTRTFNLLVMDEPTNDLDLETLDLLESLLVELEGTLLLVSHDRAFLDDTVTSTLVLEGRRTDRRVRRWLLGLGAPAGERRVATRASAAKARRIRRAAGARAEEAKTLLPRARRAGRASRADRRAREGARDGVRVAHRPCPAPGRRRRRGGTGSVGRAVGRDRVAGRAVGRAGDDRGYGVTTGG